MTVPTIDLATPDHALLDAAARRLGFFRVRDPGLPAGLAARCTEVAMRFFALPAAVKRRYGPAGPGVFNGYWGPESELSGALFGAAGHFDIKEKFKISRPDDTGAYDPARPEIGWAYQPNRWPVEIPEFEGAFRAFYEALDAVARRTMAAIAGALGLPAGWFDDKLARHESTATWNYYPPQVGPPADGQFRSSAHRDIGSITLLIEGAGPGLGAGGLEVQDADCVWHAVAYEPGTVMVNVGDLMRRWTNDRWTSALHRVVNPPPAAAGLGRVSLAFFQKPAFDTVLAALAGCVAPGEAPRHEPMTAGEYMRWRMLHSVGVVDNLERVFEPALMRPPDPAYGRPAR